MKIIKEFKITCLGCGNVTHRPFVDFAERERIEQSKSGLQKGVEGTAKGAFTGVAIAGASMACLPLGCCLGVDAAKQSVKKGKPIEWQIRNYCQAFICKKCHSTALTIDVIEHNV
jgi:hypothetical protein